MNKIENFLLKIIPSFNINFGLLYAKKIVVSSLEYLNKKITINTNKDFFLNFCFKKNDQQILAASRQSRKIQIFDLKKGLILRSLLKNSSTCQALSFSPDGNNLISGDDNGVIIIWEISLEKKLYSIKTGKSSLKSVFYWPENNQVFASSNYDGFVKFFDIRSNNLIISSFNHGCPVENFSFTNKGKKLITIGGNNLKIWNLCERKLEYLTEEKKAITGLSLDENDKIFYSCLNRNIKLFTPKINKIDSQLWFKKNIISFVSLSNNLIIGFSEKILLLKNSYCKRNKNRKILDKKNLFIKLKKDVYSHVFFLPNKEVSLLKKYEKYVNVKCSKKKKKKVLFLDFIKKSIDNLLRNNNLKKILDILFEHKKFSIFFLIISELISKNKLKKILNQFQTKNFLFLINLITENLKDIFPTEFFTILLKISENFFPIIFIFYSKNKINAYLKILNAMIHKSIEFYILNYCIDLKTFYL
jgi:WD40 repeat protein